MSGYRSRAMNIEKSDKETHPCQTKETGNSQERPPGASDSVHNIYKPVIEDAVVGNLDFKGGPILKEENESDEMSPKIARYSEIDNSDVVGKNEILQEERHKSNRSSIILDSLVETSSSKKVTVENGVKEVENLPRKMHLQQQPSENEPEMTLQGQTPGSNTDDAYFIEQTTEESLEKNLDIGGSSLKEDDERSDEIAPYLNEEDIRNVVDKNKIFQEERCDSKEIATIWDSVQETSDSEKNTSDNGVKEVENLPRAMLDLHKQPNQYEVEKNRTLQEQTHALNTDDTYFIEQASEKSLKRNSFRGNSSLKKDYEIDVNSQEIAPRLNEEYIRNIVENSEISEEERYALKESSIHLDLPEDLFETTKNNNKNIENLPTEINLQKQSYENKEKKIRSLQGQMPEVNTDNTYFREQATEESLERNLDFKGDPSLKEGDGKDKNSREIAPYLNEKYTIDVIEKSNISQDQQDDSKEYASNLDFLKDTSELKKYTSENDIIKVENLSKKMLDVNEEKENKNSRHTPGSKTDDNNFRNQATVSLEGNLDFIKDHSLNEENLPNKSPNLKEKNSKDNIKRNVISQEEQYNSSIGAPDSQAETSKISNDERITSENKGKKVKSLNNNEISVSLEENCNNFNLKEEIACSEKEHAHIITADDNSISEYYTNSNKDVMLNVLKEINDLLVIITNLKKNYNKDMKDTHRETSGLSEQFNKDMPAHLQKEIICVNENSNVNAMENSGRVSACLKNNNYGKNVICKNNISEGESSYLHEESCLRKSKEIENPHQVTLRCSLTSISGDLTFGTSSDIESIPSKFSSLDPNSIENLLKKIYNLLAYIITSIDMKNSQENHFHNKGINKMYSKEILNSKEKAINSSNQDINNSQVGITKTEPPFDNNAAQVNKDLEEKILETKEKEREEKTKDTTETRETSIKKISKKENTKNLPNEMDKLHGAAVDLEMTSRKVVTENDKIQEPLDSKAEIIKVKAIEKEDLQNKILINKNNEEASTDNINIEQDIQNLVADNNSLKQVLEKTNQLLQNQVRIIVRSHLNKCLLRRQIQDSLEPRVSELEDTLNTSQGSVTSLEDSLQTSQAAISSLKKTLRSSQAKVIVLEDSLHQSETRVTDLEQALYTSQENVTLLEKALQMSEARINKLENVLCVSNTDIVELEQTLKISEARTNMLLDMLKVSDKRLADMQTTQDMSKARVAELESLLDTSNAHVTELKQILEISKARGDLLSDEVTKSEARVTEMQVMREKAEARVTHLESILKTLEETLHKKPIESPYQQQ